MSPVTFANRWNLGAIEDAYQKWQANPQAVDDGWQRFFEGFELGQARPTPAPSSPHVCRTQTDIVRLIYAYRNLGHFLAHLDPLNEPPSSYPGLELSEFSLTEADLNRTFDTHAFYGLPQATLNELIAAMRQTYCRTVGVEYMHIQETRIRQWLQERMEPRRNMPDFDRDRKLRFLKDLHYAELFERFLQTRFVGQKRFSLEGAETLIPLLEAVIDRAANSGVREVILGMTHRGRLNVLANTLRKPYQEIFTEFEENYVPDSAGGDGDVKYHLGFSSDRTTSSGAPIHVSLSPNPSHLEAVDPVVEGRTRAKQDLFGDRERKRGMPVLLHGDAAFAGQGLVAETLNLSQLPGYTTGGTVHIVINNQIGFTTRPCDARSTTYCTDVAKMVQVPIFHVNGEDPEAAVYVAELALDFRQTFNRDVVIDLFCYRRHGHNETDEPSFTQPLLYGKIQNRPTLTAIYTKKLIEDNVLTEAETEAIKEKFETKLQSALEEVRKSPPRRAGMRGFSGHWKGLSPQYSHAPVETGVPFETLNLVVTGATRVPEGFTPHPKIVRLLETRRKEWAEKHPIDWTTAETLAFGSLVLEGTPVRLSGQDSQRGTFSQRHAVLHDMNTDAAYYPLKNLSPEQAPFHVYDSTLSEAAVLGFEFGYALDAPKELVLWEAQFGDFANGAQVIIDQFIAASETKWQRDSGLVMLLPHGYEGQGPEHSSARLERFLQLSAEDNIQVCYPTSPAQYFHMLRRQLKRNFRKPLIVMTPKSTLRHKVAVSPIDDFVKGYFHEILDDSAVDPVRVRRVILCGGKVYYDLLDKRTELKARDVAIVRVEQFYPYPADALRQALSRYRKVKELVWAQEESLNMGAWSFMEARLRLQGYEVVYVGRDASASPATGSHSVHKREQKELVEAAFEAAGPHLVRSTANGVRANGHPELAAKPETVAR
ncbi:MAG: 2-oxoglutarate dehydrogenase E1 component [Gemmataceae bacterium]